MKQLTTKIFSGILLLISHTAFTQNVWNAPSKFAQQVLVGSTGSFEPSAIIEGRSTTKGFLMPRMTTAQRNAISSPATGLQVFDTDSAKFFYYNGSSWWSVGGGSSSSFWGLTGNAGTTPGTNFIGTTDAQNLIGKTNNVERFTFGATGQANIQSSFAANDSLLFRISNNLYGFGIRGALLGHTNLDGFSGIASYDGSGIGQTRNQSSYGFSKPGESVVAFMLSTYDSIKDRSYLRLEAKNASNRYTFSLSTDTGVVFRTPIRIVSAGQGNGKVLTSDASGNATWQAFSYGEMGFGDSSVLIQLTQNTPVKVTNVNANLWQNGARDTLDVSYVDDSLIINKAGVYNINGYVSLSSSTGATITIKIYLNGALLCDCNAYNSFANNRTVTIPFADIKTFAVGDVLEIYVENTGNNDDVTVRAGKAAISMIKSN